MTEGMKNSRPEPTMIARDVPENWPPQEGDVWERESGTFTAVKKNGALTLVHNSLGITVFADLPGYPPLEDFGRLRPDGSLPVLKSRKGFSESDEDPAAVFTAFDAAPKGVTAKPEAVPENWPPQPGDEWIAPDDGTKHLWTVRASQTTPGCILIERKDHGGWIYSDLPGSLSASLREFAKLAPTLSRREAARDGDATWSAIVKDDDATWSAIVTSVALTLDREACPEQQDRGILARHIADGVMKALREPSKVKIALEAVRELDDALEARRKALHDLRQELSESPLTSVQRRNILAMRNHLPSDRAAEQAMIDAISKLLS